MICIHKNKVVGNLVHHVCIYHSPYKVCSKPLISPHFNLGWRVKAAVAGSPKVTVTHPNPPSTTKMTFVWIFLSRVALIG